MYDNAKRMYLYSFCDGKCIFSVLYDMVEPDMVDMDMVDMV